MGYMPQTPIWGVNRHFQAKRATYSNFHIIYSDSNQTLHSDEPLNTLHWLSQNVVHKSKMANGCFL